MKEILEKVKEVISDYIVIDEAEITLEKTFADLGLDSIDLVSLFLIIEDAFDLEISEQDAPKILSVDSLVKYLETKLGNTTIL